MLGEPVPQGASRGPRGVGTDPHYTRCPVVFPDVAFFEEVDPASWSPHPPIADGKCPSSATAVLEISQQGVEVIEGVAAIHHEPTSAGTATVQRLRCNPSTNPMFRYSEPAQRSLRHLSGAVSSARRASPARPDSMRDAQRV